MSNSIEINEDGILIRELSIENSELVAYLEEFEDPEDALENLIEIALDVRSRFMTDLETQTVKDAVDEAIENIREIYEGITKEMKDELEKLVDPENGPVITALNSATGENLKKLLNPEPVPGQADLSPIARLRSLLNEEINNLSEDINLIKTKLGLVGQARRTPSDGVDFEGQVDWEIQKLAKIFGDSAESTGAIAEIGNAKKGDTRVTLNLDDTNGHTVSIIWESKTDKEFKSQARENPKAKDDLIRKTLNETMNLRGANVGIFVLDSSGLDLNSQPAWKEYEGNKLLLVLDTFNPEAEILRVAYLWARWKAKSSLGKIEMVIDSDGIENVIKQLVLKLSDLRKIKLQHTAAKEAINASSNLVGKFHDQTKILMNELAGMVSVKIEDVPDFEDN